MYLLSPFHPLIHLFFILLSVSSSLFNHLCISSFFIHLCNPFSFLSTIYLLFLFHPPKRLLFLDPLPVPRLHSAPTTPGGSPPPSAFSRLSLSFRYSPLRPSSFTISNFQRMKFIALALSVTRMARPLSLPRALSFFLFPLYSYSFLFFSFATHVLFIFKSIFTHTIHPLCSDSSNSFDPPSSLSTSSRLIIHSSFFPSPCSSSTFSTKFLTFFMHFLLHPSFLTNYFLILYFLHPSPSSSSTASACHPPRLPRPSLHRRPRGTAPPSLPSPST